MEYRNGISADDYNALRKAVGWKVLDGEQAASTARITWDSTSKTILSRPTGFRGILFAFVMGISPYQNSA